MFIPAHKAPNAEFTQMDPAEMSRVFLISVQSNFSVLQTLIGTQARSLGHDNNLGFFWYILSTVCCRHHDITQNAGKSKLNGQLSMLKSNIQFPFSPAAYLRIFFAIILHPNQFIMLEFIGKQFIMLEFIGKVLVNQTTEKMVPNACCHAE